METVVIVEPAEEPVSIAEAKRHARIPADLEDDGTDATIALLIRAARRSLEKRLGRAFVTQTLETTWFDRCGELRLPRAPVQSVVSVGWRVLGGVGEVVDPIAYDVATGTPGVVRGVIPWPRGTGHATVRYVAGYGDAAAVPDEAKLAILCLVAHWYDRREPIVTGTSVADLPWSVDALIDSLRWGNYPL